MREQEANELATKIKKEAPTATVEVVQDGVLNWCVNVTGAIQFRFLVRDEEQWQHRKQYIVE